MNPFARDDVFPSWFVNSVQRLLSLAAFNFAVTKQDATHIHVEAGADPLAAAVSIQGRWRWNEATVSRAHPGGAAGTYDIFAVSKANKIDTSPAPGTDDTDYSFELRIVEATHTPPIEAGVVDIFRKVGSLQWSGTEITRVDQTVPLAATHAHRHAAGQPDAIAPADIGAATETEVEALRAMTADALQAGVIASTDWSFTATINGGTGVLSTGATGGAAWIKSGAALLRTVTPSAALSGLVPPALPVSGKYMSIGVQIKPGAFGGPATVSVVSGIEKATETQAFNAPAAPVAGAVRLRDLIVKNTAGVYSIVAERDRRPWARGASFVASVAGEENTTSHTPGKEITTYAARLEFSGVPVLVTLFGLNTNGTGTLENGEVDITAAGSVYVVPANVIKAGVGGIGEVLSVSFVAEPTPGSQLNGVVLRSNTEGKLFGLDDSFFSIQELVRPSAINGTS